MKPRLTNFLLTLGSLLFIVLLLEIVFRIAGFNPFGDLLNGRELILRSSNNATMVYELTPNTEGFAWDAPVKINSFGFRDRDYSLLKEDTTYRIGIIGDSITFGNKLSLEATYPKRLEKNFEEEGLPVEVLNFGVGGYDTAQEVAFLKQIGLQFNLDEVVLGYCVNDVGVASANLEYIKRASRYGSPIFNLRLLQFLRSNVDRIENKIYNLYGSKDRRDYTIQLEVDPYIEERMLWIEKYVNSNEQYHDALGWYSNASKVGKVVTAFEDLRVLSHQHRFKVLILIIPFVDDHIPAYEWAYDIVRYITKKKGFDVVEVHDEFVETGIDRIKISRRDSIHPNELGHRIIAKELFDFYMKNWGTRVSRGAGLNRLEESILAMP